MWSWARSEQAQAGMGTLLAHLLSTRRTRDAPTLGQGLDQLDPQQMPHVSPASVKKFSRYSKCPIFSEATKRAYALHAPRAGRGVASRPQS